MKVKILCCCFHGSIWRKKKKKRDGFWKGLELECKGMMGMFFRLLVVVLKDDWVGVDDGDGDDDPPLLMRKLL